MPKGKKTLIMRRRLAIIREAMTISDFGAPSNPELTVIYNLMVQSNVYIEPLSKQNELLLRIMFSPEFKATFMKGA
jgi:hypothetical protein